MEKKQTAVEWLIEQLNQKIDFIPMNKWDMIRDIVQQAKEMEKEQIVDSYIMGSYDLAAKEFRPEQYYNEIYGKKTRP
jgi:succinate dehydrogenase/fumarate reductase-like Fe-S protein